MASLASSALADRVRRLLRLERGEERRTALLFGYSFFLLLGLFVLARVACRTLYVKRLPPDALPGMYVGIAATTMALSILHQRLQRRLPRSALLPGTLLVSAVALALAWGLAGVAGPRVYPALLFGVEALGAIAIGQFWTLATDVFTAREARRVFGLLGLGGALASLFGFLARPLVGWLGVLSLLPLSALSLAIAAAFAARSIRRASAGARPAPRTRGGPPGRHARVLLALTVVTFVAVTLVDFALSLEARARLGEEGLAQLLGTLLGATGVLSFVVQSLLTSRWLERTGLIGGLLVLPIGLGATAIATIVHPSLVAVAAGKAVELLFRYTLHDSSVQLAWVPVPGPARSRGKALDALAKPLATAGGGFLCGLLLPLGVAGVPLTGAIVLAIVLAWVVLTLFARRSYVDALLGSLADRAIDPALVAALRNDADTRRALRTALASSDAGEVQHAIELCSLLGADREQGEALVRLCAHPAPGVRAEAAGALGTLGTAEGREALERALGDEDPTVRTAAVRALATAPGQPPAALWALCDDADDEVRSAAIRALLGAARGDPRALALEERVRAGLSDPDGAVRAAATRLCDALPLEEVPAHLGALLADASPHVRQGALLAAHAVVSRPGDPRWLVLAILSAGTDPRCRAAALRALDRPDEDTEAVLASALGDPDLGAAERALAARTLGTSATDAVVAPLLGALASTRGEPGRSAAAALSEAVRRRPELAVPRDEVLGALAQVLGALALDRAARLALEPAEGASAACFVLGERIQRRRVHALDLVEVLYPRRGVDALEGALRGDDARARANALEAIDNLPRFPLRRALVSLFEPGAWPPGALGALEPAARDVEGWLAHLADTGTPFEAACAAHAAVATASAARSTIPFEMLTVVERVLRLRRIGLLAGLPSEELVSIAHIAEERRFAAGDVVFRQGGAGDALYLVVVGKVRVHRGDRELSTLGPGECFGELAVLDRAPRSATVSALEELTVLTIAAAQFADLLRERPELSIEIVRVLATRLRAVAEGG